MSRVPAVAPRTIEIIGQIKSHDNLFNLDPVPASFPIQIGDLYRVTFTGKNRIAKRNSS